jgi:hypothetical protein
VTVTANGVEALAVVGEAGTTVAVRAVGIAVATPPRSQPRPGRETGRTAVLTPTAPRGPEDRAIREIGVGHGNASVVAVAGPAAKAPRRTARVARVPGPVPTVRVEQHRKSLSKEHLWKK